MAFEAGAETFFVYTAKIAKPESSSNIVFTSDPAIQATSRIRSSILGYITSGSGRELSTQPGRHNATSRNPD
jgi:hypothetical protein